MKQLAQESSNSGLTWTKGTTSEWEFYERTLVTPPTVTRGYPELDLYLNGTARVTTSTFRTDSGFDYETRTYPRRRTTNASVQTLFGGAVSIPVETIDKSVIYNKIRARARGEATNLAQMLAEYRKTAVLFRDLTQAFLTKGRSLLKKSTYQYGNNPNWRRRSNDPSKTAGGAYLQWTYGVAPLMGDMHKAMKELTSSLDIPLYIQGVESRTVRGTYKGESKINSTVSSIRADVDGLKTSRYRCQYRIYIDHNQIRNSLVSHGFGNPLAIAWELVPFSFVVDWWVNIGEVLQSLDNLLLIDKIYVLESTSDRSLVMYQTKPDPLVLRTGAATIYQRTDTRRVPVTISKVASLRYKSSVSVKHIMNGLALLTQFRR